MNSNASEAEQHHVSIDLAPRVQSAAASIMARRGLGRPSLKRNMSSFSLAVSNVDRSDDVDLTKALEAVSLDKHKKEAVKEDIKLANVLKNEPIPATANPESIPVSPGPMSPGPNRYMLWECGFGMKADIESPSSIPTSKSEFLEAVNGELTTLGFVRAGLAKYLNAINSGEHAAFTDEFLKKQNTSTQITFAQLNKVEEHLNEIVEELNNLLAEGEEEVRVELQEVFAHARPWVARTRKIMMTSHVFYKVNYALLADTKKEKE